MEQTPQNTFDYDSCRRVWQRVSPELDPYPAGEGSAGCPAAPAPDLKRLQELIEGELGDRRAYLCAARCAPHPVARRTLQRMAADEGAHARRLLAVYYLACGQCYRPALLRQRYHEEVCAARQYDRAAQSAGDACLSQMFRDLSRDETRHARQLMALLEQNILAF